MPASIVCAACQGHNRPAARFCGHCGILLAPTVGPGGEQPEPRAVAAQILQPNTPIGEGGRYRIEQKLGGGSFGTVYLAHDTQLSRACVIKQLRIGAIAPSYHSWAVQAFEREALLLAALNNPGHPNIPEIFAYLADERCLVMKHIAGRSLSDLLAQHGGRMPEEVALPIIRDVCAALVYLHARRPEPVIHRDVKPQNILIGDDGRVWLVDFGLGKSLPTIVGGAAHPGGSTTAGTPGYAPHEQLLGHAEPASDIYALARTLAVLLTGALPAAEAFVAPQVRPALAHLITRGQAHYPADRPTAQEFLTQLKVLIASPELRSPPPAPRPPPMPGFVGRVAELAAHTARLADVGYAAIVGMAGVGKTALAATLAAQAHDPARTFWYTFHEGEGVEGLIHDLAAFLAWNGQVDLWALLQGGRYPGERPAPALILDYGLQQLRGHGYLVCLDDLQHVEDTPLGLQFADRLMTAARAGDLRLIVTSRTQPAFVKAHLTPLTGLNPAEADALLQHLSVPLAPGQTEALYQRTGGNPQLITLAADALRRTEDPALLIGRLEEVADIAGYLLRTIDRSLSAVERGTMVAIATLLDYGGTREAVEAVLDGENSWHVLLALQQRHLITAQDDLGNPVYGQHELVRSFYYQQPTRRERALLHQRAADHYEHERDLLKAARHYTLAEKYDQAADLACADIWAHVNRGAARSLRSLIEQIPAERLNGDRQISLSLTHGEICALLSDGTAAHASFQRAITLLDHAGNPNQNAPLRARAYRGMGESLEHDSPQEAVAWLDQGIAAIGARDAAITVAILNRKASALIALGDYDLAQAALEQSLRLAPSASAARADALTNLDAVNCAQGEVEAGLDHYREALVIYERAASTWKLLGVWQNLGIEQIIAGRWAEGEASLRRALAEAERLGSVVRLCDIALSLGILAGRRGKLAEAQTELEQSVALARRHTLREQLVAGLASLSTIHLRRSDLAAAGATLAEARVLAEAIDARDQLPELLRGAAMLRRAEGDLPGAAAMAEEAAALAEELGLEVEQGASLRELAVTLQALGRGPEAAGHFTRSADLLAADPYEQALTNLAWGASLHDAGNDEQGAALLAAARRTLEDLGAAL